MIDAVEPGFTAFSSRTSAFGCARSSRNIRHPIWAASPQGEPPWTKTTRSSQTPRETFGKGAARKIRAAGKIPAVLYGHGTDPQHLTLPAHQVGLLIRKANAVLDLQISGKSQLALVKDVQKDPVHQVIEHLDLIVIKRGEKVQVEVPVHVEGESFAGTIADLDAKTLLLEVEATHIPESVVVSVEGLEEGTQIHAKRRRAAQGRDPDQRRRRPRRERARAAEGRPGRRGRR